MGELNHSRPKGLVGFRSRLRRRFMFSSPIIIVVVVVVVVVIVIIVVIIVYCEDGLEGLGAAL